MRRSTIKLEWLRYALISLIMSGGANLVVAQTTEIIPKSPSQYVHLFSLNDQLKVELVRLESASEANGKCTVVAAPKSKQPVAADWEIPMADEELFYFRLTILSDKELYPVFLNIENDKTVSKLFPGYSSTEFLRPGETFETFAECQIYKGSSKEARSKYSKIEKFVWLASGSRDVKIDQAATTSFNQGLTNARAAQAISGSAMMSNLGAVYGTDRSLARPIQYYEVAVLLATGFMTAPEGLSAAHNNLGLAYYALSANGKAIENYELAIKALGELKEKNVELRRRAEAAIYNNLGQVHNALAQFDLAVETYQKALILKRQLKDQEGEFIVLNNLGSAHNLPGKYPQALEYFEAALKIAQLRKDKTGEATVLNNIASAYRATGRRVEAERLTKQSALLSNEAGNRIGQAYAVNNLALLRSSEEKFGEAAVLYKQALQIFREVGNRAAEAVALSNLMFAHASLNQPSVAIYYGKQSINITQILRGEIVSLDKESRESFLNSRKDSYRKLANILVSEGRLPEAQSLLDLLKDEEYGAATRSGEKGETVPYNQVETEAINKIGSLVAFERERAEIYRIQKETGTLSPVHEARLEQLRGDIAKANASFDDALTALGKVERSAAIRVDEIKGGQELQGALTTLIKKTKSGVVALYTVLGTEEEKDVSGKAVKGKTKTKFGWVIMVREASYTAYPIDVANIEETVFQFRNALSSDTYQSDDLAKKIYTAIFRQPSKQNRTLEQDLTDYFRPFKDKTIMWSLDGILRYIPMAALQDDDGYIVEKYRNILFTKHSLASITTDSESDRRILGVGVSEKRENFSELPGVKTELETIISERDGESGILSGVIRRDQEFKKQAFLNMLGGGAYPVVHVASHYNFDLKMDNSYLLVGDGRLTFKEMGENKNLFGTVDLLTLSACDTGVTANAQESEGFAYLAKSLGAKSVIASLWKVSDAGTPELMIRFYKLLADNPGMSKAEAFQKAQLSLLSVEATAMEKAQADANRAKLVAGQSDALKLPLFVRDDKKPYAHPHYWASFVLIGNWK